VNNFDKTIDPSGGLGNINKTSTISAGRKRHCAYLLGVDKVNTHGDTIK
jgi:hypothetical protein